MILLVSFIYTLGNVHGKLQEIKVDDVDFIIDDSSDADNNEIIWFEQPKDIIDEISFKVIQVIEDNIALVNAKDKNMSMVDFYTGATYLIASDEDKYYYDEEIINVPKNMVVRHVGIYKYNDGLYPKRTIPIIKIMNK